VVRRGNSSTGAGIPAPRKKETLILTVFLEAPGQETVVTFPAPPLKDGLGRTVFLRTVSCYEMPGGDEAAAPRRKPLVREKEPVD